jgi:hypothetical protein
MPCGDSRLENDKKPAKRLFCLTVLCHSGLRAGIQGVVFKTWILNQVQDDKNYLTPIKDGI